MVSMKKRKVRLIRRRFLGERADFFAKKLRCPCQKAIKAILRAEALKWTYQNMSVLMGKQHIPLTQIDIPSKNSHIDATHTTLPSKEDI